MVREAYPTDLTDDEWRVLAPLIPPAKPGGRPRRVDLREILNGIRDLPRGGGAWLLLPHDLPTVYASFRRWQADRTWETFTTTPRPKPRAGRGCDPAPSTATLDSQSVKTTERGGRAGRRRQEDERPQTAPSGRDRRAADAGGGAWGERARSGWSQGGADRRPDAREALWCDGGDRGALVAWAKRHAEVELEVVAPPKGAKGFQVLPRRWVVERSIAWIGRYRRLSKDDEALTTISEGRSTPRLVIPCRVS